MICTPWGMAGGLHTVLQVGKYSCSCSCWWRTLCLLGCAGASQSVWLSDRARMLMLWQGQGKSLLPACMPTLQSKQALPGLSAAAQKQPAPARPPVPCAGT